MYQPDAIAAFRTRAGGPTSSTANEGDAREYTGSPGFVEERRVGALALDPVAFPNGAFLKMNANLGRLNVTRATGNTDGDGDFDALYTFGARSFAIWSDTGELVFDSGDQTPSSSRPRLRRRTSTLATTTTRSTAGATTRDPSRRRLPSASLYGAVYAFVGLERVSGIMIYNVSNPVRRCACRLRQHPRLCRAGLRPAGRRPAIAEQGSVPNPAASPPARPEVIHFIAADDSPTGKPLLAVANEISGTASVFEIVKKRR